MMKKITLLITLFVASFGFSQSLPFDFSNSNQLMTGDGGAAVSIIDDSGNDVLQIIGGGAAWDNAQINFAQNLDLSDDANNTMTFKIKPVNGTGSGIHLLKFESAAVGGDQELEFTTSGTDWQTITLDFGAGLSNYGKMVIFTDKGENNTDIDTYLIDDIAGGTNITGTLPTVALPFTFSDPNQLMTGDGGATVSIIDDSGNDVLQMIGAGAAWDNAQINFTENVDLSDDAKNTISFKIKPVNGTGSGVHLLKFENAAEGGDQELEFTTTGTEWQTISLDFGAGLSNYGKMVIFTDKGENNTAIDTYLIDDVMLVTPAPAAVALPFDFEGTIHGFVGGDNATVSNGTGNNVLEIVGVVGGAWDNASVTFDTPIDLSDDANNTLKFTIQSTTAAEGEVHQHGVSFQSEGQGSIEANFQTVGQEVLNVELDFEAGLGSRDRMHIFTDVGDFGNTNATGGQKGNNTSSEGGTYIIDNITLGASSAGIDATLSDIKIDGTTVTGFDSGTTNYVVALPEGTTAVPTVTATTNDSSASAVITPAGAIPGDTKIEVTAANGTSKSTYTVSFVYPVTLPFNFSSSNQLMNGDGGAATSIIDDGGNDVLQMIGSGAEWDNAQINFTETLDLSDDANNTITFKIKPVNGTGSGVHLLKFELPSSGGDTELEFATTGTDWQTISLDFPAGLSSYGKMVLFTDKGAGNSAVDTYLIDDIQGAGKVLSIGNNRLLDFSMYPNPAANSLNISAKETIQNADIFNVLGKKVMSLNINKTSESIDISNLSSGVYLVKYNVNGTVGISKFIKQ